MSEIKNEFKIESKDGEIIVRTGEAPENFKVRQSITVSGQIDLPFQHLSKHTYTERDYCELKNLDSENDDVIKISYLTIDRDQMVIVFREHAGLEYESNYTGKLLINPDFKKFGINDYVTYTPLKLAETIKMNRSFFENKTEAMKLVSELMGFEAKVNKEVEAKADERANRRVLLAQTVSTNIPEAFKMKLPIFKGAEAIEFEVEIGIDPIDLSCRLISPEVNDIINETKNEVIDEQKELIKGLHPDLRIFEI